MTTRVLMYHGLESPARPIEMTDPGDLLYVLTVDAFERHLDWLARDGWRLAPPGAGGGPRTAVLTFDDGHITNHQLALPCLRQRGLTAAFFITTNWTDSEHYMSRDMLAELADAGMVIGSHGASHSFLTDLSDTEAIAELETSRDRLADIVGGPITTISAPGGRVDARIARLIRAAGYTDLYTSDNAPSLRAPGLRVHGRLALKRTYSDTQFATMVRRNREPGWLVNRSLRVAKRVLGNRRYLAARAAALRVLELRKRR